MTNPDEILSQTGWIRALARALLLDQHQVDDVVQTTMVRALMNPPRRGVNLRAWLAVVTRNTVRQSARSNRRRFEREQRSARPERIPSTEELVEKADLQRSIVQAVMNLDEPYRSALLLRYLEELSAEEIAHRLGIPSSTVRNRIKRGLDTLRVEFDRESGGDRRAWSLNLIPLAITGESARAALQSSVGKGLAKGGMNMLMPAAATAVTVATLGLTAAFVTIPDPIPLAAPSQGSSPVTTVVVGGAPHEEEPLVAEHLDEPAQPRAERADEAKAARKVAPKPIHENAEDRSVRGIVVDQKGAPVANASVFVGGITNPFGEKEGEYIPLEDEGKDHEGERRRTKHAFGSIFRTDADGRFAVTIPQAKKRRSEESDRIIVKLKWSPGIHPTDESGTWTDVPGSGIRLLARRVPTATLEISVLDRSTNRILPRFHFTVSRTFAPDRHLLDGQGNKGVARVEFELQSSSSESFTVDLHEASLPKASQVVELSPGDLREVQLTIETAESVIGQVVNAHGDPLENALVFWGRRDRMWGRRLFSPDDPELVHDAVETDADGQFSLRGVGSEITVWHAENSPKTVAREDAVEVRLPPRGAISGRVTSWPATKSKKEKSKKEDDRRIVTLDRNREIEADENGRFEFDNVLPGTRSLFVNRRHFTVEVASGQTSEVEIGEVLPKVRVEFVSDGQPFVEKMGGLVVSDGSLGSLHEMGNRNGVGEISRVLPGSYLFITHSGRWAALSVDSPNTVADLGAADLTVFGPPGAHVFVIPDGKAAFIQRVFEQIIRREIPDSGRLNLAPLPKGRYGVGIRGHGVLATVEVEPGAEVTLDPQSQH